ASDGSAASSAPPLVRRRVAAGRGVPAPAKAEPLERGDRAARARSLAKGERGRLVAASAGRGRAAGATAQALPRWGAASRDDGRPCRRRRSSWRGAADRGGAG